MGWDFFKRIFCFGKTVAAETGNIQVDDNRLIRLPIDDSKQNYLNGFWRWVELLAADDYEGAIKSLYWQKSIVWTAESLRNRITAFFGGDASWSVVIPNERLVNVINQAAEWSSRKEGGCGWLLAQIPLTTEPNDPKNDGIPLMGLACSFFIREYQGGYVLEHEIFHL